LYGTSILTKPPGVVKLADAVVICGGGPGELLASILLNNIGIKLTVVEQAMENISGRIRLHTIILNERGENLL
jgi:2-polyprenyl-6-methoxyphenol hydroxylase-like FAD-dependent oxidoreductase